MTHKKSHEYGKYGEKTRKQFHFPSSGIIIKFGGYLLGIAAVIVLIQAFGATFSIVVEIYLGYKLLGL